MNEKVVVFYNNGQMTILFDADHFSGMKAVDAAKSFVRSFIHEVHEAPNLLTCPYEFVEAESINGRLERKK